MVKDGFIEKMFIQPDVPGHPFEVSDADTMLNYINGEAALPKRVTVFTKPGCPHCTRAKKALAFFRKSLSILSRLFSRRRRRSSSRSSAVSAPGGLSARRTSARCTSLRPASSVSCKSYSAATACRNERYG